MSNCALQDDEINEYLGDNLSDVSGLDFVDDLDDEVDLLCSDIGPSVQEVFVSSPSNTPVSSVIQPNVIPRASPENVSDSDTDELIPSTSTSNVSGLDIVPGPSGDGQHTTRPKPKPAKKRKRGTISGSSDGSKKKKTRSSKQCKPKKTPITFQWVNDGNYSPNIFEFDNSNCGIKGHKKSF